MQASTTRPTHARRPGLVPALAFAVAVGACVPFAPALRAGFVSWDDGLTVTDNYAIRSFGAESLRWMWTTSHAGHYQPLAWMSLALDPRYAASAPDFRGAGLPRDEPVAARRGRRRALRAGASLTRARARRGGVLPQALAVAARSRRCCTRSTAALRVGLLVTERRDAVAPFFCWRSRRICARRADGQVESGWLALRGLRAGGARARRVALLEIRGSGRPAWRVSRRMPLLPSRRSPPRARRPGGAPARRRFREPGAARHLAGAKAWDRAARAAGVLDAWPLARLPPRARCDRCLRAARSPRCSPSSPSRCWPCSSPAWAQTAQQGRLDVLSVHTPGERIVQALYGLAFYPAKTLLPTGLAPLYPVPDDVRIGEPRFLAGALATLLITALTLALARRLPALCAAWFAYAVTVAPVLGVLSPGRSSSPTAARTWPASRSLCWPAARCSKQSDAAPLRAAATVAAIAAIAVLERSRGDSARSGAIPRPWQRAVAGAPDSPRGAEPRSCARSASAKGRPRAASRAARRPLRLVREAAARRPASGLYRINEAIVLADRAADVPEPGAADSRRPRRSRAARSRAARRQSRRGELVLPARRILAASGPSEASALSARSPCT
jgi:hypothetical protein